MPFRDGTGPVGLGPRTGRGAGYCAGRVAAGVRAAGGGLGVCRGIGVLGRCNPLFTIATIGLVGLTGLVGVIGLINRRQTATDTPEPVAPTV